jgi:hypothetical protein
MNDDYTENKTICLLIVFTHGQICVFFFLYSIFVVIIVRLNFYFSLYIYVVIGDI